MIVKPRSKGFICTTAHPTGCRENVISQIEYSKTHKQIDGPKKVLIIGCSTGYGLATRISSAYSLNASTIGVMFEREAVNKRTATAGFYNTKAFEEIAQKDGHYAKTINGDAFSREIKEQTIALIKEDLGEVDMVIYSLASPRRTTDDGTTYNSVLKTAEKPFTNKSWNQSDNTITEATLQPATEEEVFNTVKVMGGEDWIDWIDALSNAGVLAKEAITIAYSYIGPEITYPIYYQGTIGIAKQHLLDSANKLNEEYNGSVKAYVSVNKAIVTQASSAIPIVPLYCAILYKIMKEKGTHENCIQQIERLFHEKLFNGNVIVDELGRIRLDDYELQEDVQKEVMDNWDAINSENIKELSDIAGYMDDFFKLFGFNFENVDYELDVEI